MGFVFAQIYNNSVILYFAVGLSILSNIFSYWYSDRIVLAMSRARPATREEFFDVYTVCENLSITAGLPMPKLYIIDDPAPNAFATGRDKEHAVVCVTRGLADMMDRTELEGVISHELSHIGNRDILLSTVVVVLVGFLSVLSDLFIRSRMWGGNNREEKDNGYLVILGFVLALLAPIAGTLIQLAISRQREFLADASGSLLTRNPEGLARALQKLGSYSRPLASASNATAHLFITNPFGARATKGLHKLFMTHPPIEDRIKALRDLRM
ncbi:MAG: M48 family metallopeptidase [Candidatus Vogelbacteria bacterium]|nr:M48 family metallopeptidase [Candidatus Vogelbacteria bacterium]